jgi:hypothetical protein
MSKETGGSAFPWQEVLIDGNGNSWSNQREGMTLRDVFAKEALGLCFAQYLDHAKVEGFREDWRDGVASDAYMMADAMLVARNK